MYFHGICRLLFVTSAALLLVPLAARAQVTQASVTVDGMACPFCAFGVEKKLREAGGVESAEVDLGEGIARLKAKDGGSIVLAEIAPAVEQAGFTPGPLTFKAIGRAEAIGEGFVFAVRGDTQRLTLAGLSEEQTRRLPKWVDEKTTIVLNGTVEDSGGQPLVVKPASLEPVP